MSGRVHLRGSVGTVGFPQGYFGNGFGRAALGEELLEYGGVEVVSRSGGGVGGV